MMTQPLVTPDTIDVPRLRKELEFATVHPEMWNQSSWITRTACGTAGCLAGNTVLHEACEVSQSQYQDIGSLLEQHGMVIAWDNRSDYESTVITLDGGEEPVSTVAQRMLGLNIHQANMIFQGENTIGDLWFLASAFTGGEIEMPPGVAEKDEICRQEDVDDKYRRQDMVDDLARNARHVNFDRTLPVWDEM